MLPIFKPTVLIFDLDETTHLLFKVNRNNQKITYPIKLSKSAEIMLSQDKSGIYDWYICRNDTENTLVCMQAIAREEFKKILDRVYDLQQQYQGKNPIAVKIITRGEYEPHEIKQAWDKFYSDGDKRFTQNLFPLELFNFDSLKEYEFDKSELMEENYSRWKKELPGLTRDRVCILDDDSLTVSQVRTRGFSAIHFPTVVSDREENETFTEHGPKAFEAIHRLFDETIGMESSPQLEQESADPAAGSAKEIAHVITNENSKVVQISLQ